MPPSRKKRTREDAGGSGAAQDSGPSNVEADELPHERTSESQLFLWGSNSFGQLGFGPDVVECTKPTLSSLGKGVEDVALGAMHTLVLMEDNTLWSFGVNDEGALGRPTKVDENDDPVEGFDATRPGKVELEHLIAAPIEQAACCDNASFILTEDGCIHGWGTLKDEHGVLGFSELVESTQVPLLVYRPTRKGTKAIKIATGSNHVIAILENGDALSWGDNSCGQLGRISLRYSTRRTVFLRNFLKPTRIHVSRKVRFVDAACGEDSTILKTNNGRFLAFGLNGDCQLSLGVMELDEQPLSREAKVECGSIVLSPQYADYLKYFELERITIGKRHAIGCDEYGVAFAWGSPFYGVLGSIHFAEQVEDDEKKGVPEPHRVDNIPDDKIVTDMACGPIVSGCVANGELYTWGAESEGMCGYEGEGEDVPLPRKVPRTRRTRGWRFKSIDFGSQHAAAIGAKD